VSPVEVALALKLAYTQGSWDAVGVIINEIENVFGEVPLSKVLSEDGDGPKVAVVECGCDVCEGDGELTFATDGTIWLPWNGDVADG
jgi:hypothetical protein